jgi:GrpB-like predicted nucleotidyltransferase (UPF0157 family)
MIGLPTGVVNVLPYTAGWQRLFGEEQARLWAAIGAYVLDIQHIGSTSVPGLAAKPIIDIGVAVADFEEAVRCIQPLVDLGYRYLGENGIPRRHFFVKGEPRTHNLHMNEIHSSDWLKTIRFRDYLRRHPDAAVAYAEIKLRLAQQYATDLAAYQDGKDAFIKHVLDLIRAERRGDEQM